MNVNIKNGPQKRPNHKKHSDKTQLAGGGIGDDSFIVTKKPPQKTHVTSVEAQYQPKKPPKNTQKRQDKNPSYHHGARV